MLGILYRGVYFLAKLVDDVLHQTVLAYDHDLLFLDAAVVHVDRPADIFGGIKEICVIGVFIQYIHITDAVNAEGNDILLFPVLGNKVIAVVVPDERIR